MKPLSLLTAVLGAWMIVAGFGWSGASPTVMTERIVAGVVIVLLALGVIATSRVAFAWLVALAGVWTLVAPSALHYRGTAALRPNDLIVGVLVLLLGFFTAISRPAVIRTHA